MRLTRRRLKSFWISLSASGLGLLLVATGLVAAQAALPPLTAIDVFEIEVAADPRISPDGSSVVYARSGFDIFSDRAISDLWLIDVLTGQQRPLTSGEGRVGSPRWSPDGSQLIYLSSDENGRTQIYRRWMDTGQTARLSRLERSPSGLSWSPDGRSIAFTQFVPDAAESFAEMPAKPEGATWAPAAKTYERLFYRSDGGGFVSPGFRHIFVLPVEGGTPRQVTQGDFDHGGTPQWTPDSQFLIFSANRKVGWELDSADTEVHELRVSDGSMRTLTSRHGPDDDPVISPDGKQIAYTGSDEQYLGFQRAQLWVMERDGTRSRSLTAELDRSVSDPQWSGDGRFVYFQYSDLGNGKVGRVDSTGRIEQFARDVGGVSIGRPYGGGSYSLATNGTFAYTRTRPESPSDIALVRGEEVRRLTHLNEDLLDRRRLGEVEEVWWESSADGRRIQGWLVKPPQWVAGETYPLILEIHGGPFTDYGDRFTAEIQLYAAAGYGVLYCNPRGSTSYGEEFANLIHHAYPGDDYFDLMSGIDAVLERGWVDPQRLFVTGGSGGGVLSSWIVGHNDRFSAAAVQKPVINWYSWALTADIATTWKYWFGKPPWEDQENYMRRSPISYVGNVTTPTLLITGEQDFRTPISESEQFYQALKLREVPSALVRIPEASHGIADRPSHLIAKVQHILAWFSRYPRRLE